MKRSNKKLVPNIVRGGIAIPLGRNYYYMRGRKHSTGGIDIGNSKNGLEVEDGEVMHLSKYGAKVFSAVPFLNGESPANKVMKGENPNTVFNAQERFKDKNKINDDGSKKKALGGDDSYKGNLYPTPATQYDLNYHLNPQTQNNYVIDYTKPVEQQPSKPITVDNTTLSTTPKQKTTVDWDNTEAGKLINYVENRDSVGFDKANKRWYFPTKRGFDKNQIGIGIDKKSGGSIQHLLQKDANNKEYMQDSIAHVEKYKRIDEANRMVNNRLNKLQSDMDTTFTISPTKRAVLLEGMYNRGAGNTRKNEYNKKNAKYHSWRNALIHGTDSAFIEEQSKLHKEWNRSSRAKDLKKFYNMKRMGGSHFKTYSTTINGKTKMNTFSTGRSLKRIGGPKGINPDLFEENLNSSYNYSLSPDNNESSSLLSHSSNGSTPPPVKSSFGERFKTFTSNNENAITDGLGIVSNIASSLISHRANKKMLNSLKFSDQPVGKTATKLKTKININPQLDKMRETIAKYEKDINQNTASSNVALARKQQARLAGMLHTNELYGRKENAETELINKDRLNQQNVAHANIDAYNKWAAEKRAFENTIADKKSENDVSLIQNLNSAIQGGIDRSARRKAENKTVAAMIAANPHTPIELFENLGLINNKTAKMMKAVRSKKGGN